MIGMTEALRARGRPRAEENPAPMEIVLAAAVNEFAVHGYNGVSVRTLSRTLGVSHNLLHQRFGSKEALWRAAVDWAFGPLVAVMDEADDERRDPRDRLRTSIRSFVPYYLITSGAGSIFARIALTERLFGSEPLQTDQYDRYADIIADVIVNSLRPDNWDGSH